MAGLTIVTWLWGTKYGPEYVSRLETGCRRQIGQPFNFVVAEPHPADIWWTERPGCLARVRMFDPEWQAANGIGPGDRAVCMDLDSIVTGPLDPLFDRPEPFVILGGANASNPCPFNGSLWMIRGGYAPETFYDLTAEAVAAVPFYEFPDDQAWFAARHPDAATWQAGRESGVYAFGKPGWPGGTDLPADARLVVFPGWRDPAKFADLPWVRRHWLQFGIAPEPAGS